MITRIRELLEARQLSPTQFADLIGVGRPVISHILSERNKPSLEVVQKIISAFPDISLPWLLAGTGPMLAAAVAAPPPTAPVRPVEPAQQPTVVVPPVIAPVSTSPTATPPSPRLAAFERPAPPVASQASSYPQPPKFRPGVAASASFRVASPPEISVPVPDPTPAIAMPTAVASPGPLPLSAPTATLSAVSPLSPLPLPTESLNTASSPALPTAEVPALATPTSPELAAPDPHPAAALSFLGEPGKAIRRIVIFYRDGSFSDYLPDGN